MRALVMAIAGLFGGFLVPLLLIKAYRAGTNWLSGSPGHIALPLTYAPEMLALAGAGAVPLVDVLIRRRHAARTASDRH